MLCFVSKAKLLPRILGEAQEVEAILCQLSLQQNRCKHVIVLRIRHCTENTVSFFKECTQCFGNRLCP